MFNDTHQDSALLLECLNYSNASNDEYIKDQSIGLTFSVDDPLAASSGFGQVLLSWLHMKDPEHGQTATFIQDSQPQPTGLTLTLTLSLTPDNQTGLIGPGS